jgi:hypothetical protein
VLNALIGMELGRSLVSFKFGGSADNILFGGTGEQQERYLLPTIEGKRRSCFALSEPNTGSDATNIQTRDAIHDGALRWLDAVGMQRRSNASGLPHSKHRTHLRWRHRQHPVHASGQRRLRRRAEREGNLMPSATRSSRSGRML